jgi:hypothetical protein
LEVPIETRARNKRLARDRLLAVTDGLIARHRDEIDSGFVPTLTAEKFSALQSWRHALRSITRDPGFPDINLPLKPEGL